MELNTVHFEAIFDAMVDALRDEDNWNFEGADWVLIDNKVYAEVRQDKTLSEDMYDLIFDLHAEIFEEDYDLTSYNAFHNQMLDEIYEQINE